MCVVFFFFLFHGISSVGFDDFHFQCCCTHSIVRSYIYINNLHHLNNNNNNNNLSIYTKRDVCCVKQLKMVRVKAFSCYFILVDGMVFDWNNLMRVLFASVDYYFRNRPQFAHTACTVHRNLVFCGCVSV